MSDDTRTDFFALLRSLMKHKMFFFMVGLLLFLILQAALEEHKYAYLLHNVLSTVLIILGVSAMGTSKTRTIILIILALPWFVSEWYFTKSFHVQFTGLAFFIFLTAIILESMFKSEKVTPDTLFASVCVYLLLGLTWASIYGALDLLTDGSILTGKDGDLQHPVDGSVLIYYSFTTLTTLGYGDISPVMPMARILSVLEAVTGLMYIAFLVATLVSIYTAEVRERKS